MYATYYVSYLQLYEYPFLRSVLFVVYRYHSPYLRSVLCVVHTILVCMSLSSIRFICLSHGYTQKLNKDSLLKYLNSILKFFTKTEHENVNEGRELDLVASE